MKLSIIIPIYNTSQWLRRCLMSCVDQGLKADEYEIIAVNDGSTDDSLDELERLREELRSGDAAFSNLVIVNQENQGLSMARNAGLRVAQGEYVWWVDGDDFLQPRCAAKLVQRLDRERLDVLCFRLNLYTDGNPAKVEKFHISDHSHGRVLDGSTFLLKVNMPPAAWCAIYRRDFLQAKQLEFLPGVYHEDQEFTPRAYFFAERIALDRMVVYNYVQRPGSIMNSLIVKRSHDLLQICDRLWDFAQTHTAAGTPVRYVFINRISFLFSQALSNFCRCSVFEFPGSPEELPYYPLSINKLLSQKERYKYRLINASVPLYMKLYRKFNSPEPTKRPRLRTR